MINNKQKKFRSVLRRPKILERETTTTDWLYCSCKRSSVTLMFNILFFAFLLVTTIVEVFGLLHLCFVSCFTVSAFILYFFFVNFYLLSHKPTASLRGIK